MPARSAGRSLGTSRRSRGRFGPGAQGERSSPVRGCVRVPEPVDVCVVGSGAGGAPIALELARAGLSVVVLEKGPARGPGDHVHDELSIVRRDFFVPFVADEPHVLREREAVQGERTNFGWVASCVGGGTVHWAGFAFRMAPEDFRRRTLMGPVAGSSVADWPISYDDLEPYYQKAETLIGVSGVGGSPFEPRRSAGYPVPPLPAHPISTAVERAATALGLHPYPTPKAILSQPYRGRSACMLCDFCGSYGCEMGAKGSTADALLPEATATGRCEVRPFAMAREVVVDRSGKAVSVLYSDRSGALVEQRAGAIVLACSTVETPRLLLASRSSSFPDGLANSSGLVGRNLVMVGRGGGAADFLHDGRARLGELRSARPFVGRAIRDLYEGGGTLVFELAQKSPILVAERLSSGPGGRTIWGKALKDRLRAHYREGVHLGFEAFSETLPVEACAVDLDPAVRDRFGLAAARITLQRHESDAGRSASLVAKGMEILDRMRPDRVVGSVSGELYDVLQCGTCRFGTDPTASVLDPDCRAHDVPNLWIVDGSFMPNAGAVPNTLTILANSFRVADKMNAAARRGELGRHAPSAS
ncbi:MAG: GMC family oxidoreductase [Deltaproteobacteria bacterium]|nr:GMC family oxidoreductase [Deltaproteobacteria bacterium]